MSISQRLELVFQYKKITAKEFAEVMNVQRSAISHIMSGRNKPSIDFLERFILHFPEFNVEWLISGKGNMLKNQSPNPTNFSTSPPSLFDVTPVNFKQEPIDHSKHNPNNVYDYTCNLKNNPIKKQIADGYSELSSDPFPSREIVNTGNLDNSQKTINETDKIKASDHDNTSPGIDAWSNIERMILVYNDSTFEIIRSRKK